MTEPEEQPHNPYAAPEVSTQVADDHESYADDHESYADAEWLHLVTNPRRFFQHLRKFQKENAVVLMLIWVVGMSGVIDRIASQAARGRAFDYVMDDWSGFWVVVLLGGILGGAIDWLIGGFFYHIRVSWAGDPKRDKTEARLIYIFTSLMIAVPTILLTFAETATFANYRDSFLHEDIDGMFALYALVFAGMGFSLYLSYLGVITRFKVDRFRARLWFIFLPGLLYGLVIAATMMAVIAEA